jgi:hypothetical protein
VTLFGEAQLSKLSIAQDLTLLLRKGFHAKASTRNAEQTLVGLWIPAPIQTLFNESSIEGWSMPIHFSVSKGAIHIPKHGLQDRHDGHAIHGNSLKDEAQCRLLELLPVAVCRLDSAMAITAGY